MIGSSTNYICTTCTGFNKIKSLTKCKKEICQISFKLAATQNE
jgi:hypothetical protein